MRLGPGGAAQGASAAGAGLTPRLTHAELSEGAGENSSATSTGLTLLSVVHWEVSEARSVVFISPVLASGFI